MATLKDQSKTLQVEINDMKERKDKGDPAIVSTVKTENIKNLEDQLKALDDKAEKIVLQVKDLEEFKKQSQD
jgi:predicted  nucleic acid-binding Zn-ribbon protein